MAVHLSRLGGIALLATLFVVRPGVYAQGPVIPPYDRSERPGDPPPVPGAEEEAPPATGPALEGAEVQARGPIHEAFARPSESGPRPGPVVSKQPPEPIPEEPPEERPEGESVVWIPGYWSWDEDRKDFLWVSGCWRAAPPGRKWVPGYWTRAEEGWQWVSGFWAPSGAEEVPYLDTPPPESLERGPSVPAPDDDSVWVPGTWVCRDTGYVWQPGFWCEGRPGWVYCPPRYCWTPRGCLYVSGYWDHCLEDRGLLFAPVYFERPLWRTPGWSYRPDYCLSPAGLLTSLWLRPSWGHYYFGDYYGAGYARHGFYPWVGYGSRFHDPLYGYYRWRYRDNPTFFRGLVDVYRGRVRGDLAPPPRTLSIQEKLAERARLHHWKGRSVEALRVVRPLGELRGGRTRLTRVSRTELAARTKAASAYRSAGVERRALERSASRGPGALSLARVPTPPSARGGRPGVSERGDLPRGGAGGARPLTCRGAGRVGRVP